MDGIFPKGALLGHLNSVDHHEDLKEKISENFVTRNYFHPNFQINFATVKSFLPYQASYVTSSQTISDEVIELAYRQSKNCNSIGLFPVFLNLITLKKKCLNLPISK